MTAITELDDTDIAVNRMVEMLYSRPDEERLVILAFVVSMYLLSWSVVGDKDATVQKRTLMLDDLARLVQQLVDGGLLRDLPE